MRQRIELTGTNSSIGLIALISNAHTLLLKRLGFREMILVVGNGSGTKEKPEFACRDRRLRGDARWRSQFAS